jgi:phenylpropionate dioxygenase-like ring-hydroxylating dioxygenase large terminal subunit
MRAMTERRPDMRREIELGLARRALEHYQAGTTDQAPGIMEIPVSAYTDEARYQREVDHLFRAFPQAAALSVELPEPGSYRAVTILDVPILLVRDDDGVARAFVNVCRHRGARLCEDGSGKSRVFACPYHAWVYNRQGNLIGRAGADTFGEIDSCDYGLRRLACEERAGLVWVQLDTDKSLDLDYWLGGFVDELAALRLEEWTIHEQRDLPGPGWKVTMDGYLEAYHHNFVHGQTVGVHTVGNLLVHDTFGPHQRLTFGRKSLPELAEQDEADWQPMQHIRIIHSCFPNLSISGILGGYCLVSQIYPGKDPSQTVTRQTVLVHAHSGGGYDVGAADEFSDMTLRAVRDEDYPIGLSIQGALNSGANTHFLFGRNEIGLQHYHKWVQRLMERKQV